jgi:hypothetical protein
VKLHPTIQDVWQSEHQVKISHRQQRLTLFLLPHNGCLPLTVGAMAIATGTVISQVAIAMITMKEIPSHLFRLTPANAACHFCLFRMPAIALAIRIAKLIQNLCHRIHESPPS